jgi:glycosyltransferase involved in cell wall biosynthesis
LSYTGGQLSAVRWSIIVCTLNRADKLAANLNRLKTLDNPEGGYEIIIVDNGSTDKTAEVVKRFQDVTAGVIYSREEIKGLSHARNAGISVAHGELIAFIDDDAWPAGNWLIELEKGFEDTGVGCVGGMVLPVWPQGVHHPAWLHKRLMGLLTIVDYDKRRILHYPDYPAGTNIAFRKAIFEKIGYFNARLGRSDDSLLSMEESEMCLRVESYGYQIVYLPGAVVNHEIHADRLTREWLRRRAYWQGISAAVLELMFFSRWKMLMKSLLYILYAVIGLAGKIFFRYVSMEKMAFFCDAQAFLCSGYLRHMARSWSRLLGNLNFPSFFGRR